MKISQAGAPAACISPVRGYSNIRQLEITRFTRGPLREAPNGVLDFGFAGTRRFLSTVSTIRRARETGGGLSSSLSNYSVPVQGFGIRGGVIPNSETERTRRWDQFASAGEKIREKTRRLTELQSVARRRDAYKALWLHLLFRHAGRPGVIPKRAGGAV